ncbi:ArsR/SmtB family transcription factor [Acinetobacter lanii]|uniref:ArsR/SmtB family transcription factor n=1 Tax=Acinetobacter lanii TaxID=2715163 RepID=UPI00148F57B0|nr:helix-turn-helix transcriptional regulator [Acinetobacter lanii]
MSISTEEFLKVISNPTRKLVLEWLKNPSESFQDYTQLYPYEQYGVCASLIQQKLGLSQPATSLSIKFLQDSQLLLATKVGKWTYYRRNEDLIDLALQNLYLELKAEH